MGAVKKILHADVENLPDGVSAEEALERLRLAHALRGAEADLAAGRVVLHAHALKEIDKEKFMPTPKTYMRDMLDRLPDDISWEQMHRAAAMLEQVSIGMEEDDRGETVPHAEVLKEFETWCATSLGRKGRNKTSPKLPAGSARTQVLVVSESPVKYSKRSI